ncbi:MAG: dTDP-4-dehydrorhamnose reductase [Deltaproteobacteria bacterium]|nr:dTDP-4-dehydrorhamnose reductase [Deltaproteobacteria bacterium]
MKILVTGSEGQLGRDLIPRLKAAGHDVCGYDVGSLDITDAAKTSELVAAEKPFVIINCAAYTQVDKAETERDAAYAVNRDGAANLAQAAARCKARLIHISTDFVFDGLKSTPYAEADAVNPLSVYGASKLAGEEAVAGRLPEHIIVRTAWLYGGQGNNFVKTILRLASERESLNIVYDQIGTPTWTSDLSDAIVLTVKAVESGKTPYGVYHYTNEGVASWYDFAVAIVEEARRRGLKVKCNSLEPILTSGYPTPAKRPAYSVLDKEKFKKTFGVEIPYWRVSLKNMMTELYGGGIA